MMSNELNTSDEENKPVKNQANDINYLKLENVRLTNELAALKMEMVQMANLMKKFKVDKGKQNYCREHGVYQDDSSNSPPLMKK
ncbi:unnamed protein product [Rotaria magnacalcarata]